MEKNELDLFVREMADVKPIKQEAKVKTVATPTPTPGQQYRREMAECDQQELEGSPLSLILRQPLSDQDWLGYKRNGIQNAVFKNLRTGRYLPEATLNLNKKTPRQARDELLELMQQCEELNIRSVQIFIGHGKSGNLLKSYLAQWLPEIKTVQAFHTALKHHGGVAAVYVLLRKSEQKRAENRERHAARLGGTL